MKKLVISISCCDTCPNIYQVFVMGHGVVHRCEVTGREVDPTTLSEDCPLDDCESQKEESE